MNLNDFVVLPYNKAKSIKLNARNLQDLQMETVTLAKESKEMEEKLQQLKESMRKEKEERKQSGGFIWKSGQCGSLNSSVLTNSTTKNKANRLQKLTAGKLKIRVLKDEPLTAPPQPLPPPPPPTTGLRTTRKNRLRGPNCGQCEVKTAGLTDLQTHVSARDVGSYFQRHNNPGSHPSAITNPIPSPNSKGDQCPETGTAAVAKSMQLHPDPSQVLAVNHGEEKKVEMCEEGPKKEDERGFPTSLFRGEYNEEESVRSFQEALRQWRGEKSDGAGKPMSEDAMWTPFRPVSVSAMATQTDLTPDRGAEGRGREGGEGRVPVRVEFTENSLTYVDRLLLKKHRRTPIETYLLAFGTDSKSLPNTNTEEETTSSLTAQEEDFRRYCASLFAVPVSRDRTDPQIPTPESCLIIEVLDERDRDINGVFVSEQRTDNNRKVPSVQQVPSKGRTLVPLTALTSGGSSRVSRSSSSPTQPSRQSRAPAQPKAAQKLHLSKPQTSQAEHSMRSLSSKIKPSACPTAETPRSSKTSIKTPTSTSQKPDCSPTVHKSIPDHGSSQLLSCPSLPHSQTEISKSSHASPLASTRPPIPEEHLSPSPSISFSLRSTFTVSPSSSTESALLPKVYQSTPLQKASTSSLLQEQRQSSSSLKLSQSAPSNLESPRQSQHSLCDPESLLSDNELQLPLSPVSSSPNPPLKNLEPSSPVKTLSSSSLFNESPSDAYSIHRSTPTHEDAPLFMSTTPISGDHESTRLHQDTQCIPSHFLNVIHNPPLAVKMEEELSIDSGDEMSSDSLDLVPHEEESSDQEAQVHGCLTSPTKSHQEDSFVPVDAEREKDVQTDEQEQLSEPTMVMHKQSAGSGSEQFCDLDAFPPLGFDMNSGLSDTPEHTHCDSLHTRQTSPYDSEPTGSEDYGPSSSLVAYTEENLIFRMMKDNHTQPTGIQIHSTTPIGRGEISANELGTSGSGSNPSDKSTPTLSHLLRRVPVACSLSHPTLGSESAFRPLSRAAQEIMEICSVDQKGCEDPDLDTDTTAHTLHGLEQELRLMANETGKQATVFGTGNSGSQDQHGYHCFTRGRVSEEQKDEEAAAQRDRQSVILLP
ncbi:uncharacterized protein zbbx isoform X2 [Siniperca chuatsi]|uniref:uncharacterized protein zbbx isoform X2 n=1 Tax=Siniperca chuatsi TaxID=119488 RepID=UPI001CE08403|nr:uncharacterized protein zbbx isoform X2 [Siniperca chuatsi]